MKTKIQFLFLMTFLITSVSSSQIQELRGTWITNVDSYVLFNDRSIAEAMDYLSSIGINTVFVCTWNKGYTLYPSKVMNDRFGIPIWPTFSGRDPLDKVIIEAHRNGIEVIAWFEYGFSPWYAQNPNDSGHIIKNIHTGHHLIEQESLQLEKVNFHNLSGCRELILKFRTL